MSRDFTRVGVAGFEPTTSSSRTKRATKLRYTPMVPVQDSRARDGRPNDQRHGAGQSRATRVSRVASGGQAKRTGVYGEVPSPAETCSSVDVGVPRQAAGPLRVEVAVGHQRPVERHPQLPAVGVPGQDQGQPVGSHPVDDAMVRGVHDAEREVGVRRRRAGDGVVAVAPDVRVVDADELDLARRRRRPGRARW